MVGKVILLFLTGLLLVGKGIAQTTLDPVSVSTAGTFATQSRGDDVIGLNPANLGYEDNPRFQLSFGLLPLIPFPAFQLSNDAISPSWFNRQFLNRGLLDARSVDKLLAVFPKQGWGINPQVQMQLLGMSFGPYAVSIAPEIQGGINIPKPLLQLIFNGIRFNKPVDLSGFRSEAQAVIPVSFAYGYELDFVGLNYYVKESYLGLGIKVLGGAAYAKTENVRGEILSTPSSFLAIGEGEFKSAVRGFGLAFDVGFAANISDHIKANIALNNLLGFIRWSGANAHRTEFKFVADITARQLEEITGYSETQQDSLMESFIQVDTVYSIPGFTTDYPAYLLMGFQFEQPVPGVNIYLNYRQAFRDSYYSQTTPRLSLAVDLRAKHSLLMRTGFAIGGVEKFQWGIGFGLRFSHYQLDLGFSQTRGMFNNARGFALSLEQRIIF